jgi:hypothetical protein
MNTSCFPLLQQRTNPPDTSFLDEIEGHGFDLTLLNPDSLTMAAPAPAPATATATHCDFHANPMILPKSLVEGSTEGATSTNIAHHMEESSTTSTNTNDTPLLVATSSKKAAKPRKKKRAQGYRKCPQAPRRFKSPYIIFSISKMEEYKKEKGTAKVTAISRLVADEWKSLDAEERKKWEQAAIQDKARFAAEKALYTGPWQVPSKRSRKVR